MYEARLQGGWRRFGPLVFRPECPSCRRCRSLRVPVATFRPNQSQRRAWKRNDGTVSIRVGVPTSTDEKLARCRALGAHVGIDYKRQDFVADVQRATGGRGVDVVEDFVGTDYLAKNLAVLKYGGILVLVGVLGSHEPAALDLLPLILRRLQIKGSSMRPRPLAVLCEHSRRGAAAVPAPV